MSKKVVLSTVNIKKSFVQGTERLDILNGASLEIKEGEIISLLGPSGSGKSTFLQIAGLLDNADSGQIIINGFDCSNATDRDLTRMRRDNIGFVYQFHHLLPDFSALENLIIPQLIAGKSSNIAAKNAKEALEFLGLGKRITHKPAQLSGGEQQRVAIARAIINRPALLLADEPTGNLDPNTSDDVFNFMVKTAREAGIAILIVTHNHELAKKSDRIVSVINGRIENI